MSSRRFPGKVLAPFRGEPLVRRVIRQVETALPDTPIVVATSDHPSDDPLVAYLAMLRVAVFRGSLDAVFDRFVACADRFPCRWMLRVSADSPLLGARVLRAVAAHAARTDLDLVTTIFPRTFPSGHNAELISVDALRGVSRAELTAGDREHVTPFFYRHAERYRIVNVEAAAPIAGSFTVDTLEDLRRLEAIVCDAVDPAPRVPAAVSA